MLLAKANVAKVTASFIYNGTELFQKSPQILQNAQK